MKLKVKHDGGSIVDTKVELSNDGGIVDLMITRIVMDLNWSKAPLPPKATVECFGSNLDVTIEADVYVVMLNGRKYKLVEVQDDLGMQAGSKAGLPT